MSPATAGGITIVATLVLLYLAVVQSIPFVGDPYEIKAAFRDSSGIKSGSPVRVAGVDVGKVTAVERTDDGTKAAVVTMEVTDKGRPLHADTKAKIRPRIFLEGNFFVELSPGSPDAGELAEGTTIPADRTANPVQLGEVLSALQEDVRRDLKGVFEEIGNAERAGAARAWNRSLPDQEVAYRYAAIVSEALLGRNPGDLGDYVRDQGIVSGALDRDRRALRDLVTSFNTTASALADNEADLRSAVDELPRTLRTALPTLQLLNDAFPAVRRFAAGALPAVRSTGPAVDALLPLVRQLRGAVSESELRGLSRDLRAATPGLAGTAAASVPLLGELRALGSCVSTVLAPFSNLKVPDAHFPPVGTSVEEFSRSLAGLAGESRSFDANGPWFKVLGQGGVETVSLGGGLYGATATPFVGVQPLPQRTPPPLEPDEPCENQQLPDLRSGVGAPPPSTRRNTPAVRARYEKSKDAAVAVLNRQFKAEGSKLRIATDRDATRADIEAMARRLGLAGQLRTLEARVKANLAKAGRRP